MGIMPGQFYPCRANNGGIACEIINFAADPERLTYEYSLRKMGRPILKPTGYDSYVIEYAADDAADGIDFAAALAESKRQERDRDFEGACNTRLRAFQQLVDLIPEQGETQLEWEDANSRAALTVGYGSGIDHFLAGDWEMAAAIFEMVLELDPEDHLEATVPLAYAYIALEDFESFDDIINDVNDKHIDKVILTLWSEYRRTGSLPRGEMVRLRGRFAPYYAEFVGDSHPADEKYLRDIRSEKPSHEALARELWLQTEHLWAAFPGFVEALRRA